MPTYASQLVYGAFGSILCTPVSCAMAVAFLTRRARDDCAFSSPANVQRLMQQSHAYLAASGDMHMRMVSELIADFIPPALAYYEVAGLTHSMSHGVPLERDSALLVCPLQLLLQRCARTECALVLTMKEHTMALLMDGSGSILCFDPLPAVLWDHYDMPSTSMEYSGLLLYKKTPTPTR